MAEKIQTIISAKDTASSVFKNFGSTVVTLNQGLQLLNSAMRALTAPFKAVISEGADFTAQMSAVKAISKTTGKEFAQLTAEAKRIGETTAFTATQAAQAMEELRRAGQNTTQVISTTAQAMDLAAATGTDLATAASATAVQMNIFKDTGITANEIVDLMVQTVGASPQAFGDLNEALKASAGTASAFGVTFQDTTLILGAMAEAGVKGGRAGTALNAVFARLAKPVGEAQAVFAKYGITLDQINPATNDFASILDVLNKSGMEQKDIITILGQEAAPKFFKVIEQGGDAMRNFAEKQKEANTASAAAKERLDNLTGDVTLFGSALSGVKINIFETLNDLLRTTVQWATKMATAFSTFVSENRDSFTAFFTGAADAMKFMGRVLVSLVHGIGWLLEGIGEFILTNAGFREWATVVSDAFETLTGASEDAKGPFSDLSDFFVNDFMWAVGKVVGVIFRLSAEITKFQVGVLKDFIKLIKKMPEFFDAVVDALKDLKQWIQDLPKRVKAFDKQVNALIQTFVNLVSRGLNVVMIPLEKFWDLLKNVTESLHDVISDGLDKILGPLDRFARMLGGADDAAEKLDDTLTGHSVDKSLIKVGNAAVVAGKRFQAFALETTATNAAAKTLDNTLKASSIMDLVEASSNGGGVSIFGDMDTGFMSQLVSLPGLLSDSFTDVDWGSIGSSFGAAVLGSLSSLFNSVVGAITGMISGSFGRSEVIQGVFEDLIEIFDGVLAPIFEALGPIIRKVGATFIRLLKPLIDRILPSLIQLFETIGSALSSIFSAVMPIIQNILMRVIPVVTKLIEDLMPSIIQILEGLGPIIDRIMDILIPIIEALVPLLVAINEIIIELLPLIEMILRIVRGILPIITAVIRAVVKIVKALGKVVGAIIDVLMPILEALLPYIEQLAWLIGNVIDAIVAFPDWLNTTFGPVLEGIWQLLTDLVSFEGLEGIVTMLYDIWNVIVNIGSYIYFAVVLALESLWAKLEEVFQDIVKAVEGLVGGALGGGGPNVLDPTTWHDGGPVAAADLITLPGMKQNEGLAVLEDGEHVISKDDVSGSGLNINFYVTALNPREQTEEIRQLLEELFLAGKLRVS